MSVSRRDFLTSALAGSVAVGLSNAGAQESSENKNTAKRAAKLGRRATLGTTRGFGTQIVAAFLAFDYGHTTPSTRD